MKRSNVCKMVCGLVAAVVVMTWCSEGLAQVVVRVGGPVVVRHYPVYRPVVVRPVQPVIYQQPVVYRQPVVVYSAPSNPAPAPLSITMVNPESTGATLSFRINGTTFVLAPGSQRDLHFGGPRTLEFDRGGGFGLTRRALLQDGVYTFAATDNGWGLRYRPY